MRYLYLIVLALLLSTSSQAQTLHFSRTQFSTYSVSRDTSILQIRDSIYNSSDTALFNISLNFLARVNNNLVSDSAVEDTAFTNYPVSLDSISATGPAYKLFTINIYPSNAAFIVGPNVIVVWPVYQSGQAGPDDTIRIPLIVTPALGIKESPLAKIYIYQSDQQLHLHFGELENIIQQVRIYDVEGRMMYKDNPQNSENVSTAGWMKGIYLCEISTVAGERKTFKLLLE